MSTRRAALLPVAALLLAGIAEGQLAQADYIRIANSTFVSSTCKSFVPIGWNSWVSLNREAASIAASLPNGSSALQNNSSNAVTNLFSKAKTAGFTAVRLFLHGEDVDFQLQTAPGQNSEYVFRGLDYILATANIYGIRAIVVPVNNWLEPGVGDGKQQYMAWAGLSAADEDQFWTDPTVAQLIKNQLSALAYRLNVFNGNLYRNEPAIFAWDIYNEPRCPASQNGPGCPNSVTAFYADLSCYLKSVAPNHLVTTGEEGFFQQGSAEQYADPGGVPSNVASDGSAWAANVGQDFPSQTALPCIDYGTMHLWPDNWNTSDPAFIGNWTSAHEAASASLHKPLVLEEFGSNFNKESVYTAVLAAFDSSMASGGSLKGVLFWRWSEDGGSDQTTVETGDSTFQLIENAVAAAKPYMGVPVSGCTLSGTASDSTE